MAYFLLKNMAVYATTKFKNKNYYTYEIENLFIVSSCYGACSM